jgi:hypothetical protein
MNAATALATIASSNNEIMSLLMTIPNAKKNTIIGINNRSQMPSFFQFIGLSKYYL